MFRRKIFIKSFADGQITEEKLDMPRSAAKLENFIADQDTTYKRSGFKLLFPTFNRQKAKLISFGDDEFIELTQKTIRIIKDNKLKIKKTLKVKNSIKNTIITESEHHLKKGDEIFLIFKKPENFANIDFIYKIEKIISKTSFEIKEESYIPDEILKIEVIYKIDLKEPINLESIKYTATDEKIFFIDTKNKNPRTIFYYDKTDNSFNQKIIQDLPINFFPDAISYYENRLILSLKSQIYLSRTDSPFDFKINTASTYSAMLYEFNFGQKEKIAFHHPGLRNLIIATNKNLYISHAQENFLEVGKVTFKRISSFGAEDITPITVGNDLIYIEKGKNRIRLITYDYKDEDIKNFDLTRFAKQFQNFLKLAPYRQKEDSIQVLKSDGCILNLNLRTDQNNFIYGSFSKIKRQKGKFYDILSIPGINITDELYTVTEKNNEYFIEKAQPQIVLPEEYDFIDKSKYLEEIIKKQKEIILSDSSIEFNGKKEIEISIKDNIANTKEAFFENYMEKDFLSIMGKKYQIDAIISEKEVILSKKDALHAENKEKVRSKEETITQKEEKTNHFFYIPTTIKNLDYLENDKISILNNGGIEEEQIVKDGKIQIKQGIQYGIFGIGYESIIITQPLIGNILDSFSNKSIDKLLIRLKNSKNFYIGWNLNNMQEVSFTGYTYKNNEPVPLYTGDIKPNIPSSGWDSFTRLFVKNTNPTPLCLSGIYYETTIAS